MDWKWLGKAAQVAGALALLATSGCATALVRSQNTSDSKHVYPATALDGWFFCNAGLRGEPLLATADVDARNSPVARVGYSLGAVIDLPFSILFDTLLLPLDLGRAGNAAQR